MTYTGFPTIFLRKLIKAGFAMVTLMSLPALASFETMFNAQTYAYHKSGILANPVVDDHRYDFPNSGVWLGNAQTGISNAAASGIFLLPFGSNLLAQVNGGIAQARGTADNGLVRAYAFADTGPPKYYPSIQPGTTLPYSAPVFNTGAEASVSANTYTRNTVMGAPGSAGLATFSGFVEGSVVGNGALIGRDPYFPLNSRTAAVGARFIFGASSTTFAGFDCFASGAGCNSTGVTFNFGAALSTTDNGVYQVPFSVSLAVNAGEELQTWLSMEVFAQSIGVASFENTARLVDIVLSDGLSLDTSDGLLARNGNQYTLLSTLAEVVPPPLGVPEPATWSLMLAGLAACALRARKPRLSKWETMRLAKQAVGALALGVAVSQAAQATVLVTNSNALIAAFQTGATVNTLEALPGLPTATLSDGTPLPSINQIYKINGGHFHSGGASFNDLVGNPGAPSAVLDLTGALAGNARSGSHVLAPTHAGDSLDPTNATVCVDGTCFFEIEFTSPIAKFGAFIGFGNVQVTVKDRIKLSDGTDSSIDLEFFSVNAGDFFGVTNATANIDSVTITFLNSTTFVLDDITTGGVAGGGGNTVPEPGTLALLLAAFPFVRRLGVPANHAKGKS
jgi:PEP-CTERM motif